MLSFSENTVELENAHSNLLFFLMCFLSEVNQRRALTLYEIRQKTPRLINTKTRVSVMRCDVAAAVTTAGNRTLYTSLTSYIRRKTRKQRNQYMCLWWMCESCKRDEQGKKRREELMYVGHGTNHYTATVTVSLGR